LEPPSPDGPADLVHDLVGLLARPAAELERELRGCLLSPDPPNRIADRLTKPGQGDREPPMAANESSTGRATVEGSPKWVHGVS
jgi:hypothetical protein